ncbi:uncharacterized protein LOC111360942 [Spodoptera litura]|uniref:Uncharacterized protein LOC111360942 n=1 Tax=Spodoptera litura TaxID=69820 RepID=A0A9J7J1E9_SPOLT|nr:uncharacterized protein LOC111360942 [Spodoptera litura]
MFLLFYLFVFYIFIASNPCCSQYTTITIKNIREKFTSMMRELVLDVVVKVNQLEALKGDVEKEDAFKLGHLKYEIDHRTRRMLILYSHTDRLAEKHLKNRLCFTELVDMDNLYHEAITFIDMMKMVLGMDNLAPSKPVFRSGLSQQMWQRVVDEKENNPVPSTSPPPVKAPSGKRSNGAWNYAPEPNENLFK